MLDQRFIFKSAPFASCHASTVVEIADDNLLAAWFGGSREGAPDVGIWMSTRARGNWSDPVEVAREEGVPCWNPVLFKSPRGTVWLFYKVGKSPRSWSGAYICSEDEGHTWSPPTLLPAGLLGPIKNKPIQLSNGEVLCPTSVESYRAWTGWVEAMDVVGQSWRRYGPIVFPGVNLGVIQPTLVEVSPGRVRAFLRATKLIGFVCSADSPDYGVTWSSAVKTQLPNPNSGIDAVGLEDGNVVMVYNHTHEGRTPLNAALSEDGGSTWREPRVLEDSPGEYSYPAVIQSSDGMIHTMYTYRRKTIRHCVFTEAWLRE